MLHENGKALPFKPFADLIHFFSITLVSTK